MDWSSSLTVCAFRLDFDYKSQSYFQLLHFAQGNDPFTIHERALFEHGRDLIATSASAKRIATSRPRRRDSEQNMCSVLQGLQRLET